MSDNYLRHCYVSIVSIVPQDKLYFQYLEQGRNYQSVVVFKKCLQKHHLLTWQLCVGMTH